MDTYNRLLLSTLRSPCFPLSYLQFHVFILLKLFYFSFSPSGSCCRTTGDLLCSCRTVSLGVLPSSAAWCGRGHVSGCLSSPVLLDVAASGALCVYVPACHAPEGWSVGIFPHLHVWHGSQEVSECLLTLLLTSTAISTDLGYCDNLLVSDLSIAARGPSPRQIRQK